MTGAHRRAPEPHRVRTALKSVWWLLLLLGLIAVVSATNSKYLQIVVLATQGIIMLDLARRLAVKVLRNRLVLLLTARSVAGQWPWSAAG